MRRTKIAGITLIIVIAGICAVLFHFRSQATIRIGGCVDCKPLGIIFNPFRDRAPEHAVEDWLQPAKEARWDQLRAVQTYPEWAFQICPKSAKLLKSRIVDRVDNPDFEMVFKLWCSNSETYLFVVVKHVNGVPQVVRFKPF